MFALDVVGIIRSLQEKPWATGPSDTRANPQAGRMREGWEWDPLTGEREPLRDEMRQAVDEGRVGYDDQGNLVILDQPG